MDHSVHNRIVSFIWSIADDCLRDVFVRGRYRDVILPMFVLRRLDCLLEDSKAKVLEEVRFQREEAGFDDLDPEGLKDASGYVFYNTSQFTLKDLLGNHSQLQANFKNYCDGFSDNVKEIIDKFDLRNLARKMGDDVLFSVIEKFVSTEINLSPNERADTNGRKIPGLTNLGMGYVFEELIRRFNEENNEEAGEHFTPREVIKLMTHLIFLPIKDQLPNPITIYDPACGSGGMLTEAQDFLLDPDGLIAANVDVYLFGKEVNGETYAICKSDMMIKGNNPENIRYGSTLTTDEFAGKRFDVSLSNPPYGKSWGNDSAGILDGKDVIDPRFQVTLNDYWGNPNTEKATPRSSDGQLLFLMEMVSKMKRASDSPLGSRIASVHNGSSLFTGDAGSGESNIRRYLIENDYVDAIIQLPNNIFYNTGITTYIWVLSSNKTSTRKAKVQLINAADWYQKLRKNLGAKNCEFSDDHITEIIDTYNSMPESKQSKIFNNEDFGYYKVTIDRPLRLKAHFTQDRIDGLRFNPQLQELMIWCYEKFGEDCYGQLKDHKEAIETYCENNDISINAKKLKKLIAPATWQDQRALMQAAEKLAQEIGNEVFTDYNDFKAQVTQTNKTLKLGLSSTQLKPILNAMSWADEEAAKVIKKTSKLKPDKLKDLLTHLNCNEEQLIDYGYHPTGKAGEYIEYETDSDLRDAEQIPLTDEIHAYFLREVRPHVADAWINLDSVKIGYEISFNKHFYEHTPLRSLDEVTQEILALEAETEGMLKRLVSLGQRSDTHE